jgi:GNAT superfamily N-acetyltransferase
MTPHYRCERASPAHAEGLLALFESTGTGCFCNYWHFEGDKNAWLERCYVKTDENRAALVERLAGPELCGVVARVLPQPRQSSVFGAGAPNPHEIAGWLKLARASTLPRLYEQRVYRNLPCFQSSPTDRENVYAVGCCYVLETERGRGVGRALLGAAIEAVKSAGGVALEAFPRALPESAERLRPDEIWMGPESLFLQAGFEKVSDFRPYPVLRLHLR